MAGASDEPDGDARCDRDKTVLYVLSLGGVGLVAILSPLLGVPWFDPRYADQVKLAGLALLISGFALALTQHLLDRDPSSAIVATGCAGVVLGAAVSGVGSTLAAHRAETMRLLWRARA